MFAADFSPVLREEATALDRGIRCHSCKWTTKQQLSHQSFLRSKEGDSGAVIDYRNWQIALGRRFRSIKLWFVLRSFGVDGFKKHLETVSC